ncbi:cytidylyltransferase domain-containing protein [Hymenobacter crusticola]|uniref:Acylneuraminate cytidylyltransferase n=1 Tax=Hymenobacter crusticola TaxID=1770526 RepID=A0A243WBE9_9BACT|nr:glycosyltransferase family protein [Hymenobacter crusticola]OUJ72699.1 acylneuraminate cytidylyltransferase [Hymenobacter crusticola]
MNTLLGAGIITQARMGSTRLPGKVLLTARGISMLQYHVERLRASELPLYIATTTRPEDDSIEQHAEQLGAACYRGDVDDVLSRYYGAATHFGLTTIVRVTSDCPLLDGKLIRAAVEHYLAAADPNLYISNGITRSYPRGLDFEVFSYALLVQAQRHASSASDREHVTPYIHQNRSGQVQVEQVVRQLDASHYRLTLDTAKDFALLKELFEHYHADSLSTDELITLLDQHPELVAINAEVKQKKYDFTK